MPCMTFGSADIAIGVLAIAVLILAAIIFYQEKRIGNILKGKNAKNLEDSFESIDKEYKAMKTFRASGKSVVVVMEDTATSGAYYIAVAADRIIASPATLTGSIGVISEITNIEELLKKVGVSVEVYKSGKFKDFSSFARGRTDEEKKLIQEYIDTAYDMFVSRVSEGRNMDKTVVHGLAQGQIYSGNKALELRLIDGLGSVEDGVEEAKKLQNLTEVKIVRYRTQSALDVLLGRIETMVNPVSSLMARFTPGFRAAYLPSF